MPLEQSSSEEAALQSKEATDEYEPAVVSCVPDSVTPATLNEQNRKYWDQLK